MQDNKRLGLAFEKCLSADISDKVGSRLYAQPNPPHTHNDSGG